MSQDKLEQTVSLDSWNVVTPDNIQHYRERTDKWKPSLLSLAKQVNQAMALYEANYSESKLTPQWFITDGTLLGAYRNGKMIPHDYDFDFGICFFKEDGKIANLEQSRVELAKVGRHLLDSLDKSYTVGTRNDFSCKIEIYQESSGIHRVQECNWYNVHLDMDMWFSPDELKFKIAYFRTDHTPVDIPDVFPLSEIEFEATTWPCPKDSRVFLESLYGYIGSPAKFNPITKLYEPL